MQQSVLLANEAANQYYNNDSLKEYSNILSKGYKLNRKILLVQLPQFQYSYFNREIAEKKCYYNFPPTGLQWLAKSIENRGFEIRILDLNYELLNKIINDKLFDYNDLFSILDDCLDEYNPSVIGTTCINISKLLSDSNPFSIFLNHVKEKNKYIVMSGGASVMNDFKRILDLELCHFVMDGECENKINFLLDRLYNESCAHQAAPGIYFKSNGQIKETQGPKDIVTLKGNLVSTYKLIQIENYNKVGVLNHYSRLAGEDKPFATIQLGRGCRMNCMFCGVPKFSGRGVRQYSTKEVLDEIKYLIKEKGIRHFEWLDDDLLAKNESISTILRELVDLKKEYGITWAANNGLISAFITDDLLKLMVDSGCIGFKIGIESGNPEMLRKIRKPATLEIIDRTCRRINQYPELFVAGNYIIGFFGEEKFGQMLDTFSFSCQNNLDWASFSVFQFTSSVAANEEKINIKYNKDTAVIPARDRPDGQVIGSGRLISGPDIFEIPRDYVPSPEQVKQIWLAFNLVGNYINNKNLSPGWHPQKFTKWAEILQITYPYNCYMPLFASLGYIMQGNLKSAEFQLELTKRNLKNNDYWMHRFDQFGLNDIICNFPRNPRQVQETLDPLREKYSRWIKNG